MSVWGFVFWAVALVATLAIIIYRNLRYARALREVQVIVEESRAKMTTILSEMNDADLGKAERRRLLALLQEEKKRVDTLFEDLRKFPSQGKRIYRYYEEMADYQRHAEELVVNGRS